MHYRRRRIPYPETLLTWGNQVELSVPQPVLSVLVAMFRTAQRRWRRNRNIRMLQSLDDRTLKDIGIHRSEISSVVHRLPGRRIR